MDEGGLWELFYRTGLPAVYLAVAGQRREEKTGQTEPAETAFQPRIKQA